MNETRPRSRLPRWILYVLLALIAASLAVFLFIEHYAPLTRAWVIQALEQRYHSKVEIRDFHAALYPIPTAVAEGIVFREHGRTDVPPFITIEKLSVESGLAGLLERPRKITRVRLEGLQIHLAPRGTSAPRQSNPTSPSNDSAAAQFEVREIVADGTFLQILPKDPRKQPKHFQIRQLTLHSVGLLRPMTFTSVLINAKPPGEIQSKGEFGPWQADDPGSTAVSGSYTFQNANLGVFKGIAGTLSSVGKYKGQLGRIEVDGTSDTPDFRLTSSGHPIDLKATFHSVVDGIDGDTLLDPVNASFLHSQVSARGGVTGTPGVPGKTISLDVTVGNARIEDLLRLAVRSDPPPIVGSARFQARMILPPGDLDVIEKLYLDAGFNIGSARFASLSVQQKIHALSRRARGETEPDPSERVVSNLKGKLILKNGVASFSKLSFGVPGALIELQGTYGVRSEQLNFVGTATLDAALSEMTTGVKSALLKVVDPFFRKNGKTVIPIKITGSRAQPSFGLNLKFRH